MNSITCSELLINVRKIKVKKSSLVAVLKRIRSKSKKSKSKVASAILFQVKNMERVKYHSDKLGKDFLFRSNLERRYAERLDADDTIAVWHYEYTNLPYFYEGKLRKYIADFTVVMGDGSHRVIELKPKKLKDNPKNVAKFEAATKWCEKNGWTYEVVTEKDF